MTSGPLVPFSLIICTWQKCADKAVWVMYIPPGRRGCLRRFLLFTCFDSSGSFASFHSSVCLRRYSRISLPAFLSLVYPSSIKHQAPPKAITQAELKTRKGMYTWRTLFPFLEQYRYLRYLHTSCIMCRNANTYIHIFQTCFWCAVSYFQVFFTWTAISYV